MIKTHKSLSSAPDDTVQDLDFSLFDSHDDNLYDALADLSFEDEDVVIDVSDQPDLEEHSIHEFATKGCKCKQENHAAQLPLPQSTR